MSPNRFPIDHLTPLERQRRVGALLRPIRPAAVPVVALADGAAIRVGGAAQAPVVALPCIVPVPVVLADRTEITFVGFGR